MVEGVLFDSGGVLIQPRGGRWWPIHGFENAVLSHFPHASFTALDDALAPAMAYMDRTHPNEDWREFYRILVRGLDLEPRDALLEDIVAIKRVDTIELFDDVIPCLSMLRDLGIPMAVVSDAWPELPELHRSVGIRDLFVGYAISAVLGCTKPDERMYAEGARVLGLPAEKLLFIDDCDDLVEPAIGLGYQGVTVCRSGKAPERSVPWVRTLDELKSFLPHGQRSTTV